MSDYPEIDAKIAEYQRTHDGRHVVNSYRPWECDRDCPGCERDNEVKLVSEWLRSADAGAMFGSMTWSLRQQIAERLDRGLHRNWRDRVDSTY